jgi:hypothetical protein
MDPKPRRQSFLIGMAYLFEGGLAVLAWALSLLLPRSLTEQMRWDMPAITLGIGITLPMLAGFALCVRWPVGPLARIKQFADEVVYSLFAPCSLIELAALSFLAGIAEEAMFRGVIQGWLGDLLGPGWGLVLASAIFGLLHCITLTYALLAMLLGLYLGGWWLATDNLAVAILAHGLYDFVALVWLTRTERTGEPGA